MIINPGRNYTDTGTTIKIPFECSGYGASGANESANIGNVAATQEPITAIRISSSAGNLQGTGAVIRTWGYR